MRVTTLFNKLLRLQGLWVAGIAFDDDELVLHVKAKARRLICPDCGTSRVGRASTSTRRWRHLAIWGHNVWIEGEIRRLRCRPCGRTVTEAVPWARHGSDFTRPFEDAVGLLAQRTDKTAVSLLFSIAWATVSNIAKRLVGELLDSSRLDNLRRIGVDEISFRKGHRYLTIVTDHDTGRVVWAGEGKCSETLRGFFLSLSAEVRDAIEIVTMDMSQAYQKAVREALPKAVIAFDHFHVAKLANEALNEVRRELVRTTKVEDPQSSKKIKGFHWPTLYRASNLPDKHFSALCRLRPSSPLGRAYLLKEQLLHLLRRPLGPAVEEIDRWMNWASRSRLKPFVRLSRTIRKQLHGIHAFMQHLVSNALAEGINNKIRLISHRAFGFHSAASLISSVYLCCGGINLPEQLHLL